MSLGYGKERDFGKQTRRHDIEKQTPPPLPPTHCRPGLQTAPAHILDFRWSEHDMKMKELVDVIRAMSRPSHDGQSSPDALTKSRYVSYMNASGGSGYSQLYSTANDVTSAGRQNDRNRRLDCGLLCRVTAGYRGDEPMYQIGADEMYWVRGVERQRRMVTKDSKGRFLSIPLTYNRKFSPSYDGRRYENYALTLVELCDEMQQSGRAVASILVENDEPVLLNIGPSGPSGKPAERLGSLTYVDTYEEKYVAALPVANGEICCETSSIPVHMTIEVALAEDFVSTVCSDFRQWLEEVQKSVEKVKRKRSVPMCQEIIIFKDLPGSSHQYDYMEPAAFIVEKRHVSDNTYGDRSRTYEEIRLCIDKMSSRYIDHSSSVQRETVQVIHLPPVTRKGQHIPEPVLENSYEVPPPVPVRLNRSESLSERSPGDVISSNSAGKEPPPELFPRAKLILSAADDSKTRPPLVSRTPTHAYEHTYGSDPPNPYTSIKGPTGRHGNVQEETMTSWGDLSPAGVIRYLRLLHLDKYTSDIEEEGIDGQLIVAMSEGALISNLHFVPRDAALLRTFIENDWYPPFECNSRKDLNSNLRGGKFH